MVRCGYGMPVPLDLSAIIEKNHLRVRRLFPIHVSPTIAPIPFKIVNDFLLQWRIRQIPISLMSSSYPRVIFCGRDREARHKVPVLRCALPVDENFRVGACVASMPLVDRQIQGVGRMILDGSCRWFSWLDPVAKDDIQGAEVFAELAVDVGMGPVVLGCVGDADGAGDGQDFGYVTGAAAAAFFAVDDIAKVVAAIFNQSVSARGRSCPDLGHRQFRRSGW